MSNQPTPLTIRSIETASGRISYAEAGSGPVALFVHGVVLNKDLWRHQLAGLRDVDPGFGARAASRANVEYAVAVLGVRDVVICGHSDCGAMTTLAHDHDLARLPAVSN
jgi:pimeloyl-ACP methyl ester carboxylesterase